jgi:hypothetical protein
VNVLEIQTASGALAMPPVPLMMTTHAHSLNTLVHALTTPIVHLALMTPNLDAFGVKMVV